MQSSTPTLHNARLRCTRGYSIYAICKLLAMAAVILWMGIVRHNNINKFYDGDSSDVNNAASGQARCDNCWKLSDRSPNARLYEFARCWTTYSSTDWKEDDARTLLDHPFFSFKSWTGRVSEVKWYKVYAACYFCVIVCFSALWVVVPWVKPEWSNKHVTLTLYFANFSAIVSAMPLHWFNRVFFLGSEQCYTSSFGPAVVLAHMLTPILVVFALTACLIVALYVAGSKASLLMSWTGIIFGGGYGVFVTVAICLGLSLTSDYACLAVALLAALTPLEVSVLPLMYPPEDVVDSHHASVSYAPIHVA